jgi:hypothetical protein
LGEEIEWRASVALVVSSTIFVLALGQAKRGTITKPLSSPTAYQGKGRTASAGSDHLPYAINRGDHA